MRSSITVTVLRDTAQWGLGAWIGVNECIVRQGDPRWLVLLFAGLLMGVPGIIALRNLRPELDRSPTPSTTEPQSSSPSSS